MHLDLSHHLKDPIYIKEQACMYVRLSTVGFCLAADGPFVRPIFIIFAAFFVRGLSAAGFCRLMAGFSFRHLATDGPFLRLARPSRSGAPVERGACHFRGGF